MSTNYYDVVVIGTDPGPLAAGALLARRGFRVLVSGERSALNYYNCYGFRFIKKPFLMEAASSPVISRVMNELSCQQMYNRILTDTDPAFQVVLPDARVGFFKDPLKTRVEIERELPQVKGSVDAILREIGRLSTEVEKLLNTDMVIPPESFFERREFARSIVQDPFLNAPFSDIFEYLKISPKLKQILEAPLKWATESNAQMSPFLCVRKMGTWLFDTRPLKDGKDSLTQLLCNKIIAHGGDIQENYKVENIIVKRGKVAGVRFAGREESTATGIVLTSLTPSTLSTLVNPSDWTGRFKTLTGQNSPKMFGYSLNLGVSPDVIPAGMADTVFTASDTPDKTGFNWLKVMQIPQTDTNMKAINISCVIPEDHLGSLVNGSLRDSILDRIRQLIPFLDNHLQVIHSPFDSFEPVDINGASQKKPEAPAPVHPDNIPVWTVLQPRTGTQLGIENHHHRTGIKGLILAGGQVITGIETEGEFAAAWGAAKIAAKIDPGRHRFTRSLRNKVEI